MTHKYLLIAVFTFIHLTIISMEMNVEPKENHWPILPCDIFLQIITTATRSEKPWVSFNKARQLAKVSTTWNDLLNKINLCRVFNIPSMHYAAMKNEVSEIIKLKLNGHSPLAPDPNDFIPLYYAAAGNQTNALMALNIGALLSEDDLAFLEDYLPEMTPETLAILNNEDPNEYSLNDLNKAITEKHIFNVLKILSSGTVDFNSIKLPKKNILKHIIDLLVYFIQCEIESLFISNLEDNANPTKEAFKIFKKFTANPNAYHSTGTALIHYASSDNDLLPTLKFLLRRKKTNINQLHLFEKKNALQISIEYNALSCMRYLIDKGINCYHTCQKEDTILHYAARSGNLECLQELLEKYQDLINSKNKLGYTPLISAIQKAHIPCMLFLIQKKADLNIPSKTGDTALHYAIAAVKPNLELIELLLRAAPQINSTSNKDFSGTNIQQYDGEYTPLHHAAQDGKTECVKLLLDYGADKNLKTQLGYTALDLAKAPIGNAKLNFTQTYNRVKIVQLLS